jgi:hypothetical protein
MPCAVSACWSAAAITSLVRAVCDCGRPRAPEVNVATGGAVRFHARLFVVYGESLMENAGVHDIVNDFAARGYSGTCWRTLCAGIWLGMRNKT